MWMLRCVSSWWWDREPAVRIQVAEALWRLGDESGLRNLVSATQSGYPDDQMLALLAPMHRDVINTR